MIAQATGHKSISVLRPYIREGNLFNEKRGICYLSVVASVPPCAGADWL